MPTLIDLSDDELRFTWVGYREEFRSVRLRAKFYVQGSSENVIGMEMTLIPELGLSAIQQIRMTAHEIAKALMNQRPQKPSTDGL